MIRIYVRPFAPQLTLVEKPSPIEVLRAVSKASGVPQTKLLTKGRKRHVADARHVLADLLVEVCEMNWIETKNFCGWRDHASVWNAIEKVKTLNELRSLKNDSLRELFLSIHSPQP